MIIIWGQDLRGKMNANKRCRLRKRLAFRWPHLEDYPIHVGHFEEFALYLIRKTSTKDYHGTV